MKTLFCPVPLCLSARISATFRRWMLLVTLVSLPIAAPAQRLTEFLAINQSSGGLRDEDGTLQPWVEIWNQSPTTVLELINYKLSISPPSPAPATVWTIPTIHLMPDERIIIWASGKNRSVVTAPLHTNFTLPTEAGSTLRVLTPSNAVYSSFTNYPAQVADVSWGRDDSDTATTPTQVGLYVTPTPGEKNSTYTGGGVAGEVVFSETSRAFSGALSITLSQAVPEDGAVIRYSLNTQTLPTATSSLYIGNPITIPANGSSTVIRARVFKTGKLPGRTTTHGFLRLDTNAQTFSSAMPIVVVNTFGNTPPNEDDLNAFMWVWEPAAPDNRARFTNPPVIATRVVVDKRGSSTLGNPKFSLNVESRNPYDDDEQDVPLLGMPSHSDWVMHAPYNFDRSLIHNPLVYDLSNAIGRYAVRNRMAEVFMDISSGGLNFAVGAAGDYFGVYNVMEKIRRGGDRVDITRLDTYDNDAVGKTGGYIFKVDRIDTGDNGFRIGSSDQMAYYYPKERDLESPQRDPQEQYLLSYLTAFDTRVKSPNWKDPVLGYATHLDVPAAIDHHLLNVWAFNVDALRLSGYWTKDRNGKMYPGPIWDFDRALSSTDGRDADPFTWRSTTQDQGTDFFNYYWWNRLFLDPDFYQKYIDRWQELRAGPLSRVNLEARIDALNAQISPEGVNRDLARWPEDFKREWRRPFAAPENNLIPASQAAEIQRIKDYLRQRAGFMDSQWVGRVTASVPAGYLAAGSTVTLTGPASVPIYYTLDGSDPRPVGGAAPGAGATLYSGPITISTNTRLRARAYKSNHNALTGANNPPLVSRWGGPADATYTTELPAVPGNLILSEINYHPTNPTPAELAINPAWTENDFEFLEIRNISGQAVNLTGANFFHGITFAFTGPAARSMAIGESIVIAANPAAFAARYGNALAVSGPWDGTLSNSGEKIALRSATGATLFSVDYSDTWYPETDGGGRTMVAYESYPFDHSIPSAWRASGNAGGSPGAWDAASLPVSAGPDLNATISTPLNLRGEVPSAPPGPSVLAWTQTSGPGTLNFTYPSSAITTATADLPGSYRVRLSLTVDAVTTFDEATLYLADTASAWLARHPGIGALTDDAENDGRSNFMEFAFLTDPLVANGSAPPAASVQSNRMVLEYQRHSPASGVTYQVEISDSTGTFRLPNPGEITETIVEDTGTTQHVRVTDSAILGNPVRRFLRIKATAAP